MKDVNLLISNGVDINSSLELFGDMETYNETLEDFLASAEEKLQQIQTYKETSDMPNYAILVHSLKSDSKYLGFTKLAELSYQHEMESKANNFNYVYDNYNELMTEANRIVNLVKQYLGKEYEKVTSYLTDIQHIDMAREDEYREIKDICKSILTLTQERSKYKNRKRGGHLSDMHLPTKFHHSFLFCSLPYNKEQNCQ